VARRLRRSSASRPVLVASTVGFVVLACLVPPGAQSTAVRLTVAAPRDGVGAGRAADRPAEPTPPAATPVERLLPGAVGPAALASLLPTADELEDKLRLTRPEPTPTRTTTVRAASTRPSRPATGDGRRQVDCRTRRCLALTFDDGPVPGTAELLDVLRRRGVHATFFVVGRNAQAHPDLLRRMVREGHVIGNHTLDHADLTRLDAAGVRRELARTNAIVRRVTGTAPTLLRPPYGATDRTVARVARSLGLAQVTWDVDPVDWRTRTTRAVRVRVLRSAHRGGIVLSHDIYPTTRGAYARLVDRLLARGYTLVTVPELLGRAPRPGAVYSHG
jgi:peptidoglycan/xylan/chitin deacetylase (PgdA/CDA1 family)